MTMKFWQKEYKKKNFFWGLKPWKGLKKVLKYTFAGKALDLGAGEGRNSIFLAKNGFEVLAIDKIPEGLAKIAELGCPKITTKTIDMRKFRFPSKRFSLIISTFTIDFLKKSEIETLIKKIKKSLLPNGIVYFCVFSVKDPAYCKKKQIEKNTIYLPKLKLYQHFFTKDELRKMFEDFNIIYLRENRFKDIPNNKPHLVHFHNIIEFIAKGR